MKKQGREVRSHLRKSALQYVNKIKRKKNTHEKYQYEKNKGGGWKLDGGGEVRVIAPDPWYEEVYI